MIYGYRGTFESYSFLPLKKEVLEVFVGNHCLVAFRMRGADKQYGTTRYFQLPDDRIKVEQIKVDMKIFYDDERDERHEWVFIYLVTRGKILCMISQSKDFINQRKNIDKIRIETVPIGNKAFDVEKDVETIQKIIFTAVANVDSLIIDPKNKLNPDNYVYAVEIRSETKQSNPFINNPVNSSSACFSRFMYSPVPGKNGSREDIDSTYSKLDSRVIGSYDSVSQNVPRGLPSNDISINPYTHCATSCYNEGSYMMSPTQIHQKRLSKIPFDDSKTENCNKSAISISENNKSITPVYISENTKNGYESY